MYTDGGRKPDSGCYGSFLLEDDNGLLVRLGRIRFPAVINTNNGAEYSALLAGLDYCLEHGYKDVQVFTDSLLMVKHIYREWQVTTEHLKQLAEQVWARMPLFDNLTIEFVRRRIIAAKLGH
jgi:ribonuclease HI